MLKIIILFTRVSFLIVSHLLMTHFLLDTERVITEIFRLRLPQRVRQHNKGSKGYSPDHGSEKQGMEGFVFTLPDLWCE